MREKNESDILGKLAKVASVFRPSTPIDSRNLFAGRMDQLMKMVEAVHQPGLHVVVFGERGVGKTSIANMISPFLQALSKPPSEGNPRLVIKINANQEDTFDTIWKRVFTEVTWENQKPTIGFSPTNLTERQTLYGAMGLADDVGIDQVRHGLSVLPGAVIVIDEFDRVRPERRGLFTDLVKLLSDYSLPVTIVFVGVSETIDELIADHASISRSVVQVQMPRMRAEELEEILTKSSKAIDMDFESEAKRLIINTSQGLPHYTHLIGLHSAKAAIHAGESTVTARSVKDGFDTSARDAIQSVRTKYLDAIRSARRDALYQHVALACAVVSPESGDDMGYFQPADVAKPLAMILGRDSVPIATYQKHLNEFCEPTRGPILNRSGSQRSYKYRFIDPLMPPFILMHAVATELVDAEALSNLMNLG